MSTCAAPFRLLLLLAYVGAQVTCLASFADNNEVRESSKRPMNSSDKTASEVRTTQDRAWEIWHQALDKVIQHKFAEFCAQGNLRADPPLVCEVKYDISRSGQILNIELSKKTNSRICNTAAETVIRSLQKDPILNFPDGATESTIRKCSIFTYSPKHENLY